LDISTITRTVAHTQSDVRHDSKRRKRVSTHR